MLTHVPRLRTPGVIAEEVGAPLTRVLYILRTYGHLIRPIGRAGILRLYDDRAVAAVKALLTDADRASEEGAVTYRPPAHRRRADRRRLTPPQIADLLGISPDKVLRWIRTGELRATNIATDPHGRPRWTIDPDDLADFEARRASTQTTPPASTRRTRHRDAGVKSYF